MVCPLIGEKSRDFNLALAKARVRGANGGMKYVIPFLLLAACAVPDTDPAPEPAMPDTCNATARLDLIGQPATALERVLIMDMVRVIRPDDMVTMDYRENRINFYVNEAGLISDIRCG
jgi:hypothetical protein